MSHRSLRIEDFLDGASLQRTQVPSNLPILSQSLELLPRTTISPPLLEGGGAGLGGNFGEVSVWN
jgi:hypothetical protein